MVEKVLFSWNDAQQFDGLSEKFIKADLIDMSIANVGVRFGLDGPEMLPVVIPQKLADES
jgi:hypothetical protein